MSLCDMRPAFAAHNVTYSARLDAVFGGKFCLRNLPAGIAFADSDHGLLGQLRAPVGFPLSEIPCSRPMRHGLGMPTSPVVIPTGDTLGLRPRIVAVARGGAIALARLAHVVVMVAKVQVRRVDARWVIATVQHEQAIRDRPIGLLIGKAVGQDDLVVTDPKDAIAARIAGSGPAPAIPRSIGFGGETLPGITAASKAVANLRAVLAAAASHIAPIGTEFFATGKTVAGILGAHADLLRQCADPRLPATQRGDSSCPKYSNSRNRKPKTTVIDWAYRHKREAA